MFHLKAAPITNGVTSSSFSALTHGVRWLSFRTVCLPLALTPNASKIWIHAHPFVKESFISVFNEHPGLWLTDPGAPCYFRSCQEAMGFGRHWFSFSFSPLLVSKITCLESLNRKHRGRSECPGCSLISTGLGY